MKTPPELLLRHGALFTTSERYMNTYLLLRDNKQTGPYTQEQILAKGLKPYDLVWVEGKSAAWRYPSEIAELKPYAPAVEEQPYDRFYKRNHDVEETPAKEQNYAQQPVASTPPPVTEKQVVAIPSKTKKIYVTLPATASRNNVAAQAATIQETEKPAAVAEKKPDTQLEAYAPKAVSKAAAIPTTPIPDYPDFDDNVSRKEESFSAILQSKHSHQREKPPVVQNKPGYQQQQEEAPVAPRIVPASNNRRRNSLISLALAACLLLGGIAIGFVLSNTTSSKDSPNNNRVVQQKRAIPVTPAEQLQPENPVQAQNVLPAPTTNNSTVSKADTIGTPPPVIGKKTHSASQRNRDTAKPIIGLDQEPKQEDIAVNIPPVKKEEPPAKNEASLEAAMKNVYQQVKLAGSNYKTGVLGGISDLHLTISNNSSYPLDEVEVEVKYLNPDKKVVKTQTMIFNDVSAGTQKVLDVPRTNRGVSVDYNITKIHSKALGIAQASPR